MIPCPNWWSHISPRKGSQDALLRNHPYKEIPEDSHRSALNAAFEEGNISGYNGYLERLKEGYGRLGIKLGYNKTVELAKFLCNKRMVVKEGKEYKFNRDFHY